MAGLLSAEYGFAEITLLRNAKQREIVRAFNRLAQTAQENDSVLIYYAGHGHLNEGTKEGFWIPVDAEGRDDSTFVSNAIIKTKLGVTDALLTVLQPHADLVHTLTYDNGKEFAYHQTVAERLDAQGYFAHPYHSWERGLNENTHPDLSGNTCPRAPISTPSHTCRSATSWTSSTTGPANVLASRLQISYSPESTHLLHLRVESALQFKT